MVPDATVGSANAVDVGAVYPEIDCRPADVDVVLPSPPPRPCRSAKKYGVTCGGCSGLTRLAAAWKSSPAMGTSAATSDDVDAMAAAARAT